ncbi:hypothetical protein D9M72_581210 [compost metagenome]
MRKEPVLRRALPEPEHESDDGKPHADDEPAFHARQHREGDAIVVGTVKRQHRHDVDRLIKGQVDLDQILDQLIGDEREKDEDRDRERPRKQNLLLAHARASSVSR